MPVVAARELDDLRPAGVRPREPHGAHHGLGARRDEPHLLERGHGGAHLAGQLELDLGRRPERRALRRSRRDGGDHVGMGVAGDQRAPRLHPVDVAVAVDVPHLAAGPADQEQRVVAADRAHRPHGARNATGHQPAGLLEEPRRLRLG